MTFHKLSEKTPKENERLAAGHMTNDGNPPSFTVALCFYKDGKFFYKDEFPVENIEITHWSYWSSSDEENERLENET